MYYVAELPRPHYVSVKTGKQYFFTTGDNGADKSRALKQLERDESPAPDPPASKPEPPAPRPQADDFGAQVRMYRDELKLEQLRQQQ